MIKIIVDLPPYNYGADLKQSYGVHSEINIDDDAAVDEVLEGLEEALKHAQFPISNLPQSYRERAQYLEEDLLSTAKYVQAKYPQPEPEENC